MRRSGSASPPSPAMENPARSTPLPALAAFAQHGMFWGEQHLELDTSQPGGSAAGLSVPWQPQWAKAPGAPGAWRGCSRLARATGS